MKNLKTNVVGIAQLVGAATFVIFKLSHGLTLTDAELAAVLSAFGSGIGCLFAADSKPPSPPPAPPAAPQLASAP